MANKQLVFENVARDLTGGQSFDLILIDGGGSYTMYVRNTAQPPSQPGIAALITSAGATPVIAPGGGGDVVGLGTTGTIPLWTDGPNSVIGNSVLTQVAGKLITPGDFESLNFEATNNATAQNILTQTLEVQGAVLGSLTLSTGGIALTLGNIVLGAGTITFPDNVRQTFNPGATTPGLNVGSNAGDPSTPANGDVWYDSTGNLLRARVNGATVSVGAGVGGSGTLNTVPKFTGAGATVGDSRITDDGTDIDVDSGGGIAKVGDVPGNNNLTLITVDDSSFAITLLADGGTIDLDTNGFGTVTIGDVSGTKNKIVIDSNVKIDIDSTSGTTKIGDVNNISDGTLITVDDSAKIITLTADNGVIVNGSPIGNVSGTGTDDFLPQWSNGAGGVLADSIISSNGTTVSVGGNMDLTGVYKVATIQVVGAQRPAIANTGLIVLADVGAKVNEILAMLRIHGLIAT